mgnify:CR=1 FL=1
MEFKGEIKEKINELKGYAEKNDNIIWYDRVVDILYDKDDSVTDEMIEQVICKLEEDGISVERRPNEEKGLRYLMMLKRRLCVLQMLRYD